MAIHVSEMDPWEACYTFVPYGEEPVHVASDRLRDFMERSGTFEPVYCPFTESVERALEKNLMGIEYDHAWGLPLEALAAPVLVIQFGDGTSVIADGNHRIWRRWKAGDKGFWAYVSPESIWKGFTVHGVPGTREEWNEFNKNAKIRHLMK